MKATALMIGDWVRFSYPHHETGEPVVRVFQVTQIEAQLGDYYVWSEDGRVCHPEQLQPIPLTQEILEKNGFVFSEGMTFDKERCPTYSWGNNFTSVALTFYKEPVCGVNLLTRIDTKCKHEGGVNIVHNCDIESVHELQHALHLCGIEMEVLV